MRRWLVDWLGCSAENAFHMANSANIKKLVKSLHCQSPQSFLMFETNLHDFFLSVHKLKNWVNSGKSMDNCWISCQFMADMEKFYNDLIIINLHMVPLKCALQNKWAINNSVITIFEPISEIKKNHWVDMQGHTTDRIFNKSCLLVTKLGNIPSGYHIKHLS